MSSECEHVDQPAWPAGDPVCAWPLIDLLVGRRTGVADELFADLEQHSQLEDQGLGPFKGLIPDFIDHENVRA
jgi:hypothetical protein